MNSLLILGAGGHGKVVADTAAASGQWERIVFLDDRHPSLEAVLDWPVMGASTIEHVVRGTYGSGAHVYAALECDMPPFYSPIRLGMRRLIMP